MADLTITAANVVAGEDVSIEAGIAGATITAGQVVYRDTADSKYKLADADGTSALRSPRGIALNGASNGQPLSILRNGDITIGATMTAGLAYYLSDEPGGICPLADLATGDYIVLVGMAESTSVLNVEFVETGVVT
jgi:hypothetical protein